MALLDLIWASESKLELQQWSDLPEKESGKKNSKTFFSSVLLELVNNSLFVSPLCFLGFVERPMPLSNSNNNEEVVLVTLYSLLAKIQLSFLFFMGFFLMFFGHMRNIVKILKPVRVLSVES